MATKAKRKYVSKNDQEEMLKAFYDGLGDNENTFLGHKFPDEVDAESDSSDDNDDDDNMKIMKGTIVMKWKKNARLKMIVIITMMLFLKKRLLAVKVKKQEETK